MTGSREVSAEGPAAPPAASRDPGAPPAPAPPARPADASGRPSPELRRILIPLALAQFICSFAGSNMNVMINDMSKDLHTTVHGIQAAITIFLLVMAAFMIPGGKLTDKYGRVRCFNAGLILYAIGAILSALAPGLGILIIGNSILEGIGTALLIPPVYILTTVLFHNVTSRARAFGVISAAAGVGAACGPLIGGVITSAISWRASFVFQALIIAAIVVLSRRSVRDPLPADPTRRFDTVGAVLSAAGLILVVAGIVAASTNLWLTLGLMTAGAVVLAGFFAYIRKEERRGKEPLLSTALFRNRTANLGMVTQNMQWMVLMGCSFTIAAYLQVVRHYDAIKTGVIFTASTVGLLGTSLAAQRLARRFSQRTLILAGFVITDVGIGVFLGFVSSSNKVWAFIPGLLLLGIGIGTMLTPSVNIVQSSFSEARQGEISGLSRSISNLGSSFGTAIAGTVLVANIIKVPERAYGWALITLAVAGVIGLAASLLLTRTNPKPAG